LSQNSIIDKVASQGQPLEKYVDVLCGLSASGFRSYVVTAKVNSDYLLFTESKQIDRYVTTTTDKYIDKSIYSQTPLNAFKQECIFIARMTSHLRAAISRQNEAAGKVNVLYKFRNINCLYLLGILNSKLLDYYYCIKNEAKHLNGGAFGFDTPSIKELPIKYDKEYEQTIIDLVDRILAAKKTDFNADISKLEREIDKLVYDLYGITDQRDIDTIEGK
jgi:site-specific DNA-methyltransferase (adenine-specific)